MATTCLIKLCCDCCCGCCCSICPWFNCCGLSISRISYLKLAQLGLAMLSESLLIKYGLPEMDNIGTALITCLSTTIYTFTTILILLICYFLSEDSYHLIRKSLFVSKKSNYGVLFNRFIRKKKYINTKTSGIKTI